MSEIKVTASGVQFGNAWFSHEGITGYTADQLNSGNCCIIGKQYMKWLTEYKDPQSELAALREELATSNKVGTAIGETLGRVAVERDDLQQRLTAAERRNSELLDLLRKARRSIDPSCAGKPLREELDAALSGASE